MSATNSYQVNFTTYTTNILPLTKRTTNMTAWVYRQVKPVERLNKMKWTEYYYGTTYSFYSTTASYAVGARINGGLTYRNAVLEAATASTGGTFSISSWNVILPTFIGYEERLKYLDSRIVFEWALNKYFRTTFRQPNFADTTKSDIYIADNTSDPFVFLIGPDDFTSNFISVLDSTAYGALSNNVWMGPDPSLYPQAGESFNIYVPTAVYNAFPGYNAGVSFSADRVVRGFADGINYSGMPYSIIKY